MTPNRVKVRWIAASVMALVAVYFGLFGGDYGYFEVRRLEKDKRLEEARLIELNQELSRLRKRADSLATDSATLERLAREKYGLIRDGERLYRFADSTRTPRDSIRPDSTTTR